MTLGIVADEISRNFADAVRIGKSLGIRRYEIRNLTTGRAPMCDAAELLEVERIAGGEGVEITALSPGLFKLTEDAAGFARDMREVYPKAAEWAHRWRLPGLIVFGFHKPGATEQNVGAMARSEAPAAISEWLAEAGRRACADGLLLMIEPEPICWCDTGGKTVELIQGASGLKINYDPGNVAWFEGSDPIGEFDAVAPWIANVHVKDLRLGPVQFVPAGEGIIDFRAHFAALQRIGYQGPISLEPHMDGSAETVRKCKQAFERLWEGESQ
jgi:sugar phosphate isomerase/epimerase